MKAEEFDWFHNKIFIEETVRPCGAGLAWAIGGGLGIGLPLILNFGSDEMKKKVEFDCLHGKKSICLAITEP